MELFLQGPHMGFANTTLELIGAKNLWKCYKGVQAVTFPSEGSFVIETTSTWGEIKTAWFGQRTTLLQSPDYSYDRDYEYIINFPSDIKDLIGNGSINFVLKTDPANSTVTFSGLGEPQTKENETKEWQTENRPSLEYHGDFLDWNDAKTKCQNSGGHLASVTSQSKVDLLKSDYNGFWLGATNIEDGDTWKWEDGSPWNFTNWADGQPTHYGNCAKVNYAGTWKVTSCSYQKTYFCKKMVSSLKLKDPKVCLAFTAKGISGSKAVVRWNFKSYGDTKHYRVPGLSMSWNITETRVSLGKTNMFTKNRNNQNYVALVNCVYEAKTLKSIQEIWAIVAREKLNFMYTKKKPDLKCASYCRRNILEPEMQYQLTISVIRALNLNFNNGPIYEEKIADEDLELGIKMFAFMIYCPWVNSPPKCISGSKGCIPCVETRNGKSFDGWPVDDIEKEGMDLYTYLMELLSHQTDGTLVQSLATFFGDNTVHMGLNEKPNLFRLKSFYNVMYNMLNCTYGKVTVALSSLSELTNTSTVPYPEQFVSTIDKCIN